MINRELEVDRRSEEEIAFLGLRPPVPRVIDRRSEEQERYLLLLQLPTEARDGRRRLGAQVIFCGRTINNLLLARRVRLRG